MTDPSTRVAGPSGGPTRRAVLVGGAAALTGAAGFASVATAQVTTTGVIDVPGQWTDRNLAGFVVTVGVDTDGGGAATATEAGDETETGGGDEGETNGTGTGDETETEDQSGIGEGDGESGGDGQDSQPDCDYEGWPPDDVSTYDATLIDRKDSDAPEADVTLRMGSNVDVPSQVVYLVNTFETCESEHAVVELELLQQGQAADDFEPSVEVEDDDRPNEQTDGADGTAADAPGFGALGALAGAAGLAGWLARRRRRE